MPAASASTAPRFSVVHLPPRQAPPATLLEFLLERFPRVGRDAWLGRFARGLVLDGEERPLAPDTPYRAHQEVRYFREVETAAEPGFGAPEIVYADERLVVADKPPFQPVTPAGTWVRSSLLYEVAALLEAQGEKADELAPLHRLDRATSGLVIFARRAEHRGIYAQLFAERRVAKVYEAFAALGEIPEERCFEVASRIVPLAADGPGFFRMREEKGPPNAFTTVELVEILGGEELRLGRFELRPETGKKHQLRLHMARLGWPILGDRWYPELLPAQPDDPARPLCLLARSLAFEDPLSGEELSFASRRWG